MKQNRILLAKIQSRSVECPEDEYRFQAELCNTNLDTYYSQLTPDTLDQFAATINEGGIALQDGHSYRSVGDTLGQWINAEVKGESLVATARMLRDTDDTPAHLSVNEIIRRIEKGIYNDVSIGFLPDKETCNLCSKSIWSFDCEHYPGQEYEIDGKQTRATYTTDGGKIIECSIVFDGAIPGAEIISRGVPTDILLNKQKGQTKGGTKYTLLEEAGLAYRKQLIDELIKEGVRALGSEFDAEQKRELVSEWSIEALIQQTEEYKALQTTFTGGRKIKSKGSTKEQKSGFPAWVFGG